MKQGFAYMLYAFLIQPVDGVYVVYNLNGGNPQGYIPLLKPCIFDLSFPKLIPVSQDRFLHALNHVHNESQGHKNR